MIVDDSRQTAEQKDRGGHLLPASAVRWAWVLPALACAAWMIGCYHPASLPPTASIPGPQMFSPTTTTPVPAQTPLPALPPVAFNPWKPGAAERDWKYIVLHHTATTSGSVESIHEAHLKNKDANGNPWLGIGYHFVIGNGNGMPDGAIEPTFRWREQMQGAHAGVGEYNQSGIGIVLIGNFEDASPSTAQLESVKRLVGVLKAEYSIASDQVVGHGSVKKTACPGKHFPLEEVSQSYALLDGSGRALASGERAAGPERAPLRLASFKGTTRR